MPVEPVLTTRGSSRAPSTSASTSSSNFTRLRQRGSNPASTPTTTPSSCASATTRTSSVRVPLHRLEENPRRAVGPQRRLRGGRLVRSLTRHRHRLERKSEPPAGQPARRRHILKAGVAPIAAQHLFLNEIHLADPVTRVGTANKIQADFELLGWGALALKHRAMDRNFQTPTSVVANQDNTEDSSYLNLTRFAWFPMTFSIQPAHHRHAEHGADRATCQTSSPSSSRARSRPGSDLR